MDDSSSVQESIPFAPKIFHHELSDPRTRRKLWCDTYFGWKKQLIQQATSKLVSDTKLVLALIKLNEQVQEVSILTKNNLSVLGQP